MVQNQKHYLIVVVLLVLSCLSACTSSKRQPAPYRTVERTMPHAHKVFPGDSLYSIAWRYGLDYSEVAKLNRINPPYHIYPGQMIKLPKKQPQKVQATAVSSPPKKQIVRPKPVTSPTVRSVARRPQVKTTNVAWLWPTEGKVTESFSLSQSHKGIDISGTIGQSIKATANGEVVYSGSGLKGYGKLIILKHKGDFLSAYAHNQVLLVREGESVRQGDIIARMGKTEAKHVHLHFELRKNGQPVNPNQYLAKQRG